MKLIITDALFKHSRALARYLKSSCPDIEIIGLSEEKPRLWMPYKKHFSNILQMGIHEAVSSIPHDLIIPVSSHAVQVCIQIPHIKAVLPDHTDFCTAMDKSKTLQLAESLGIPTPRSFTMEDDNIPFPCVVKGSVEAGKYLVNYPKDRESLIAAYHQIQTDQSQKRSLPIIQEYVSGVGLGFFGFYQRGVLKRFYMHERIREYPTSGGASTAAKSIFHFEAYQYGKRILDHLNWNGAAMVEFKYNSDTEQLWLMEVNPKFWGSTELGLAAGLNFGEMLVKSINGQEIEPILSPDSYRRVTMRWPLDGDLHSMIEERNTKALKSYFARHYETNLKTNGFLCNIYLAAKLLKSLRCRLPPQMYRIRSFLSPDA